MMASILVLGPTVSSKGKENLDINEPAAECFKVRMEGEKPTEEKRTIATQLRSGVLAEC